MRTDHIHHWLLLLFWLGGGQAFAQGISIELMTTHAPCGNPTGTITAFFGGGTAPYACAWNTGGACEPDSNTVTLEGLTPGTYEITVTDALGNTGMASSEVLDLPGLPINIASQTINMCDGACATRGYNWSCNVGGIPPYTAEVTPAPATSSGVNLNPFNMCSLALFDLCPGQTYGVTIADATGCSHTWSVTVVEHATPQLLSSTVTGTCTNGAQGSILLEFDQPVSVYAYSSNWEDVTVVQPDPWQAVLTDLTAGGYHVEASSISGPCTDSLYFEVPVLTTNCGLIQGTVYADLDTDCVLDPGDVPLPWRMVAIAPGGGVAMTNAQGVYSYGVGYGSYSVAHAPTAGFSVLCPTPTPLPVTLNVANPLATVDFALEPDQGPDAAAFLTKCCHALGDSAAYLITITNTGPYTLNDLTVLLTHDALIDYGGSAPTALTVTPGQVEWALSTLGPFAQAQFSMYGQLPTDPVYLGTLLQATATVSMPTPDANPGNDVYTLNNIVVGPYDPNDKQPVTSSGLSNTRYYLDADTHIDYTVRFQNTGTAPAVNVYLLDTIAHHFDLASFMPLAASHPYEVRLEDERVLRFDFPGIMLPDSASQPLASIGYVSFRLRPVAPAVGDTLSNFVDIYFDLNPPIRTNTSTLVVEQAAGTATVLKTPLRAYPNPTADVITITGLPSGVHHAQLLGLDGRLVATQVLNGEPSTVRVGHLARGVYLLHVLGAEGSLGVVRVVRE